MERDTFTRILAVGGTVMVWFSLLAPVFLTAAFFLQEGLLRFDFLMPAELFPVALAGSACLVWGSLRAGRRRALIGGGMAAAMASLVAAQLSAVMTGLASGEREPTGWPWALALGGILGYSAALIVVGAGGILLVRDLFTCPPNGA